MFLKYRFSQFKSVQLGKSIDKGVCPAPSLRQRVKYGGLDRDRGWGGPFLSLRVAYIQD